MRFHTFGNESGKTIVLIHGMLNPWQIWQDVSEEFSEKYYIVIPELDAHTQGESSSFISVEDEAQKIHDYLTENHKERLFMICGLSMGGRIAATLAGMQGITAEHLVLDGAPLLPMPKVLILFMAKTYISIIRKSQKRDPKIIESFKKDFLPERYLEDFLSLADHMDEQSIKNILSSVFSAFQFKKYDDSCRILFMHGTKGNESVSKKAAIKMKEINPQTQIRCFDGYAHAELLSFEPSQWIGAVKFFLEEEKVVNHQ